MTFSHGRTAVVVLVSCTTVTESMRSMRRHVAKDVRRVSGDRPPAVSVDQIRRRLVVTRPCERSAFAGGLARRGGRAGRQLEHPQ
ncbi:MAG: hypothetical protein M3071_01395, partial [Actinomycetota bacterium]|nr:hypothetical protein [Actinomycetota bacterium]